MLKLPWKRNSALGKTVPNTVPTPHIEALCAVASPILFG
jgi:hypothetical protein